MYVYFVGGVVNSTIMNGLGFFFFSSFFVQLKTNTLNLNALSLSLLSF
jgi:hypothetical protein